MQLLQKVRFRNPEETLETLRLATEAACLGIFDWDLDSGEVHWSRLTREIFGVDQEVEITAQHFQDRLHPEDRERVLAALRQSRRPGEGEYDIEYRIVRPDGEERFVSAKGRVFFEHVENEVRPARFVGTLLDKTEQRRSQAALMQAEQLATTGRLAASIAHEINNPLEAVTNLLYLLRDETDETARKEYLRTAESELARASEIAANTLRFYRDPKGLSRVGLGPLLQSVVGLFQGRLAIRGIELNLTCEEGVEVTASQGELRQVLVHLIGNALDAMPNGGRLLVRCRAFPRAIGNMEPGAGICIADTGTGMSQELLGRVFEPFYTTKGSSGTGVGLWLSREIVRKYGFKLLVKSKVERGTVFSIYMPQRTDPA